MPTETAKKKGVTEADVRKVALALAGVVEKPSYGTPGFRIKNKLFARIHQDGASLVLRIDRDARDLLLEARPDLFFVTDHYEGYDWVLLRMAQATRAELKSSLEDARRSVG